MDKVATYIKVISTQPTVDPVKEVEFGCGTSEELNPLRTNLTSEYRAPAGLLVKCNSIREACYRLYQSPKLSRKTIGVANDKRSKGPEEDPNDDPSTNLPLPSMLYSILSRR